MKNLFDGLSTFGELLLVGLCILLLILLSFIEKEPLNEKFND